MCVFVSYQVPATSMTKSIPMRLIIEKAESILSDLIIAYSQYAKSHNYIVSNSRKTILTSVLYFTLSFCIPKNTNFHLLFIVISSG